MSTKPIVLADVGLRIIIYLPAQLQQIIYQFVCNDSHGNFLTYFLFYAAHRLWKTYFLFM